MIQRKRNNLFATHNQNLLKASCRTAMIITIRMLDRKAARTAGEADGYLRSSESRIKLAVFAAMKLCFEIMGDGARKYHRMIFS